MFTSQQLKLNPLNFADCDLVFGPVVKFGCSRRLMTSHLLGVLEPSVVLQVNRDAGCPPGVTSDRGEKTRSLGPFPNSRPCVIAVKSSSRHCVPSELTLWNRGLPALEACGGDVLVQYLLKQVMHGHFVLLAAFFVQP
jgi:hypothetical protein